MKRYTKKIITFGLAIMICCSSFALVSTKKVDSTEPFFTLVAKTIRAGVRPDYLHLVQEQLARININLDVIVLSWPSWWWWWDYYRDFDVNYLGLYGGGMDPDYTGVYDENGSLNLFGYHTSMDWDEELGTGKNEWYMREGTQIMPPNSEERIQHYWEWEDYLMDEICPILPALTSKYYLAHWSELEGYDIGKGILQSWGLMDWSGSHLGQISTDELVRTDAAWSDLNPLFQDDSSSSFISSACLDPLIWYDEDLSAWPHLAESFEMLSDTHVRIKIREGIKWNADPDSLYLNEYLDVKDVYFSIYAWQEVSNDRHLWAWIEDMQIIDQYTLDIFIDGDPSTPENESYAPFLPMLNLEILPEHYLNQTQLYDGVTPDITHPSWNTYATHCFGTGLFEITQFSEGIETILSIAPNCWKLDPVITADPLLNWDKRFGFGTGWTGIDQLRVRIIPDLYRSIALFESGKIDVVSITAFPDKRMQMEENPNYEVQSDIDYTIGFFAYNMREVRPYIGSREPCPNDPEMTIGLAIRKAISYAINRVEINNVIHGGEYEISYWPIAQKMGVWCNPNIIRYDHDLEKAKDYMRKAGFLYGDEPEEKWTFFKELSIGGWFLLMSPLYVIPIGVGAFFGIRKLVKRSRKVGDLKEKFPL